MGIDTWREVGALWWLASTGTGLWVELVEATYFVSSLEPAIPHRVKGGCEMVLRVCTFPHHGEALLLFFYERASLNGRDRRVALALVVL